MWYRLFTFNASAIKTTGVVEDLIAKTSTSDGHTSTTYSPKVAYTDKQNDKHEYVPNFSSSPAGYEIGEQVKINYDPQDPDKAQLDGLSEYIGVFIMGGLGLVFTVVGGIGVFVARRNHAATMRLKETGQLVQADIVSIEQNKFVKINKRYYPFRIFCNWKDPLTGMHYTFKSRMIVNDPRPLLAGRKTLNVYIDPNNPKKYYMDVSFLGA